MHRHYPESSRYSSRINPYDSSRRRRYQHRRGPSPTSVLERRETARAAVLSDDKVQHHEVQELQLPRAKRRRTEVYSEDKDDAYVMMEVTERERREILQRRRERDHERKYHARKRHRSTGEYPERLEDQFSHNLLSKQEQCRETRIEHSGPSVLTRASNFTIAGGQTSAVGGDQIIIGTPERYSSLVLPGPSNNLYRTPHNYSAFLGRTRPTVFTQATSFDIHGGEFSAAGGDQTVKYSDDERFVRADAALQKAVLRRRNEGY
ncbi:hypothetical protein GGU11DRAFT_530532 [Lentinula aff. detonsa]|nr:hypothetical protein GGU11DRAFT_530532 [Lentinula aff. detonsa]